MSSKQGSGTGTPRKLGRGLSSLLGEVVAITAVPSTQSNTKHTTDKRAGSGRSSSVVEAKQRGSMASQVAEPTRPSDDAGVPRIQQLSVHDIGPSAFQPRRAFDQGSLERLAASIRTAGVMQPVLVRRAKDSGGVEFELVAGERRWRAVQLAGMDSIPAVVADIGDEQAAQWALIENLQREELGAMERAWGLRSLAERFSLKHGQVADRVGLDRSSVANLIRLTELEEPIRALLDERRLSVGHGKALLGMPPGPARTALAERAAARNWSVRQTEQAVAKLGTPAASISLADGKDGESSRSLSRVDLERQLSEYLGTKVRISANKAGTKGRIVADFYDLDHFDGLMTRIGFEMR